MRLIFFLFIEKCDQSQRKKRTGVGEWVTRDVVGYVVTRLKKKMVDQIIVFILFEFILISSSLKKITSKEENNKWKGREKIVWK